MHNEAREELWVRLKLAVLEYANHFCATKIYRKFDVAPSTFYHCKQKYDHEERSGLYGKKPSTHTEKERERHPSPLIKSDEASGSQIWQILARYPLELMEDYISVDGDIIRIKHNLWSQLSAYDFGELKEIAQQRLDTYTRMSND